MRAAEAAGGVVGLMLVGALMAGAGGSDREAASELTVVGQVGEPTTIAGHTLPEGRPAITVSADPRFFCTIKLERVVSGEAPWRVGAEVVLAFHSVARTFLGDDPAGKRYRFTFNVAKTARSDAHYTLHKAEVEAAVR